ncbi:hypothetical protein B0O99DRAFT_517559 [Bisporella sp. PMI_857]|nr:hypothetical protein B0O99DRAFT_517559 [Bisporella sp. PMI_857]
MEGIPAAGFDQPNDNHNVAILAGTAATTIVATIAVALRFFVRVRIVRSTGWDDWWILASMVLSLVGMIIIIPEVQYGAGRHAFYILKEQGAADMILGLKLNFITQFTYVFALAFVKISIGLFLLRLVSSKPYRYLIIGLLGFLALYTLGGSAALLARCRPFAANFDISIPGAQCYTVKTSQALAYFNSSCGIATDLIFAFIPCPLLWKLQINRKTKLSLMGILSLGTFAASCSLVKLYYLTSYGRIGDFLWDSTYLTIWSATEVNVGITAASIPSMKPLFKSILGSTYGPSSGQVYPSQKWNGYAQQSSGRNDPSAKSRSVHSNTQGFEMHNTRSSAMASSNDRERNKLGMDNVSEESILPLQHFAADEGNKGIMKSVSISVKTDEIDPRRSVEDRI